MLFFQVVGIVSVALLLIIIIFNQLWHKNTSGQIEPYMENVGRKAWDDLFRDVGLQVNGFAIIGFIAWFGVRVGGFLAWHKHRRENEIPEPPVI